MKNRNASGYAAALAIALTLATTGAWAQQAPSAPKKDADPKDADVVVLSPFEVSADNDNGYAVDTTLAGNRLNTQLRDIGNAVTVINTQFLKDIGAVDNQSLLQYTTNTEVGNVYGNFAGTGNGSLQDESPHFINPNQNTRVRGLTSADNTRDYFLTDIPWDGYNVDGVDLQRGPNSILFGQGSPAGIINTRTRSASYKDSNEVQLRVGSFGSVRAAVDTNKVLIKGELAIRVAAVDNKDKYKEKPAYSEGKRLYSALRYEPGFLKRNGARTIFKTNIEFGEVKSNNPRQLPPIDLITPWFQSGTYKGRNVGNALTDFNHLNKILLTPAQNEDDNTGLPNHGQNRPSHNGPANWPAGYSGTANEFYIPEVGNFGNQFGNPSFFFNNNAATPANSVNWEPSGNHGIGSNGALDGGMALPYQRPAGVAPYATYAQNAKLPYYDLGVYKDRSITDPSIFNFYNTLLDGPNKKEWQNFRTYNLNLTQTFFDDHVGFSLEYNNEWYKNGQLSLLNGDKQAIGIDFNSEYPDGSPNPNVGRAYVSDSSQYGNQSYVSNRENKRATVFAEHDFSKGNSTWISKLIGRHVITGLVAEDRQDTDRRSWSRYGTDAAFELFSNPNNVPNRASGKFTDNNLAPNTVIYLGPTLLNASSAAGAKLPGSTALQTITTGTVRTFDSTWNKPTSSSAAGYVDPAAFWHNDYYPLSNPVSSDGYYRKAPTNAQKALGQPGDILVSGVDAGFPGDSTQSENPANYVGYRSMPINIMDSETVPGNRNALTHDSSLSKSTLVSKAFTWQAHFWDNALVATYGVRKDTARSWAYSQNVNTTKRPESGNNLNAAQIAANIEWNKQHPNPTDDFGHNNLSARTYHLVAQPDNTLDVTSHAYTLVAHLNQLPMLDKLPLNVSVFYNHSTDFQPAAARVDVYGQALGPPKGVTKDAGILLETKDGKYSLKINKYQTDATAATSTAMSYNWFIGSSQAWMANWVNRYEFNWKSDNNSGAIVGPNDPTNTQYNYGQAPGESPADAATREANVIASVRAWQKSVDPRFYAAWGINLNDPSKSVSASLPNGFVATEDSTSKGYEIEFNANPIKNWRLTFNASKTDASRKNVGGENLLAFVAGYQKALGTGAPGSVGDLRIWWGGAGNETTLAEWFGGNQPVGTQLAQLKTSEGTQVPELRKWRFNAISNYDFDHGVLKGVNVGVGVRYQSEQTLGYPIVPGSSVANFSWIFTQPYKSPSEMNFDLWIGYSRKISKNVDWNIQLNVRNVGEGNGLIPVTVQYDGSPASYRIKPPQTLQLTNTFKF